MSLAHARSLALRQTKRVRCVHDLVNVGPQRLAASGPPGRSAVTGQIATVFGCTGFLGRYLVAKLAKAGTQVVVPYRDEDKKRHLRVMGDLGQIVPLEFDARNEQQIEECVRHSHIVYNLVGRDYETKNFKYEDVNITAAQTIAEVCARVGVPRLVHVSHLNASFDSPSEFYRTKAIGEEVVRDAFPDATIIRPSAMFGWEDKLLNKLYRWPIWFKLNGGNTRVRPVHVMDVAQAMKNLISLPAMPTTLSLPGPTTHTYNYLLELVASVLYEPHTRAPTVPKPIALLASAVAQMAYFPMISPDEVRRRYIDDIGALAAPRPLENWEDPRDVTQEREAPGDWDKVGVTPEEIEQYALLYLRQYRTIGNFARPVILPKTGIQTSGVTVAPDARV
ncbi:putative NADH2 dehydrogenase 40K chain [Exidia glandulosa HHB12029]|uniref:Putative NADH2 dehydrogenase 40K chain n=1 Tax=Exidia glandulosa HHB12029 TaxID=1314781 RepID=A0A165M919_EXIGL|nr:putative NADH2 dehydrogenase 40K chain [Exidia glandulosa HHB12029]